MLHQSLTNFIPRTEVPAIADQCPHERIHHEPPRKNDNEPDGDVHEYLFCTRYLIARNACEIEPSRPREKRCREEYGDVDACVEDILRDCRKVANRFAPTDLRIAFLWHYLPGKRGSRKCDRRSDEKDDGQKHCEAHQLSAYHQNIVA